MFGLSQLALVIGVVAGGALTGTAGWAYTSLIHDPQIRHEATALADDACTIRTLDAASRARQAADARWQQINADAAAAYRKRAADAALQRDAVQDQLDKEIAAHEQELRDKGDGDIGKGGGHIVTDADFDWLRNKSGAGSAGAGGG